MERISQVTESEPLRPPLMELLRELGWLVVKTGPPRPGVALVRLSGPPTVILLDPRLPRLHSWQLRELLLVDPVLSGIPLVILVTLLAPDMPVDELLVAACRPHPTHGRSSATCMTALWEAA